MIQRLGVTIACALLPLLTAMQAVAQGPAYSMVEGGLTLYPNFESERVIGADLRVSKALNTKYFAFGGFKALAGDVEVMALHGGGGYRHSLDHRTDLWGGVTAEFQEIEVERCVTVTVGSTSQDCSDVSTDDVAPGLRGGVRRQVHRDLEVGGSARLVTGDLDYLGLTATGRYRWQRNLSLLVEADLYDGNFGVVGGLSARF